MGDRRFRRVLGMGIGLTICLLVAAYAAFLWVLNGFDPATMDLPFFGPNAFIGGLLSWGSIVLMLVFSIFLMIPVASVITSMFLDDVADAVEVRHYPHLPTAPRVPFREAFRDTVSFLGSGPIHPAPLVWQAFLVTRRICAGTLVEFQADVTMLTGKARQILRTSKPLHFRGVGHLRLARSSRHAPNP